MECPAPLIFFGGSRGGGKTHGMILRYAAREEDYGPNFNAIAVRRTSVSFEDAVEAAKTILRPLGWTFSMAGNRPRFTGPNGGRIRFGYLDRVSDAEQYQGRNLSDVWVEEVGQYPSPDPIDRLFGAMRSAAGVPVSMVCTGNPGGSGQGWLRDRFKLVPFPRGPILTDVDINGTIIRSAVIPSRITDNKALLESDPGYIDRLKLVGSKELVKAWLEGDWNAIEGAFFDGWDESKHVLAPFEVPTDWLRFRSMDWGFAAPFSVGWWAVVGDDWLASPGVILPRGSLVRYREWYGATGPNKGLRLDAERVAEGIVAKSKGENIAYTVADPSMFAQDGGPSLAERMGRHKVFMRPADNRRVGKEGAVGGWDQMRARLNGDGERPTLYVFRTCKDFIRTVPVLQHDPDKAEDLDTTAEDHVADEARYACMSRPYIPAPPKPKQRPGLHVEAPKRGDALMTVSIDPRKLIEDAKRRLARE